MWLRLQQGIDFVQPLRTSNRTTDGAMGWWSASGTASETETSNKKRGTMTGSAVDEVLPCAPNPPNVCRVVEVRSSGHHQQVRDRRATRDGTLTTARTRTTRTHFHGCGGHGHGHGAPVKDQKKTPTRTHTHTHFFFFIFISSLLSVSPVRPFQAKGERM